MKTHYIIEKKTWYDVVVYYNGEGNIDVLYVQCT